MSSSDPHHSTEEHYFDAHSPPPNFAALSAQVERFVSRHAQLSRRVVVVSSGGTTVPLENQTVRFIDNFSAGTRGATSAEHFLSQGYAVIFLHRQFSLLPYSRHYSHSTNCFLDFLTEWGRIGDEEPGGEGAVDGEGDGGEVVVKKRYRREMLDVLRKYREAKEKEMLLLIPFTTVTSYLFLLREIALHMQVLRERALFYLAAAVSDFFVPPSRMAEHKIQSGDVDTTSAADAASRVTSTDAPASASSGKKLVIDLDPVPKFLKPLVEKWAPDGMIVSFKLETDPSLLLSKCHTALKRYQHHLVIGNLLATRKWEVVFVDAQQRADGSGTESWIRLPRDEVEKDGKEIESLIVPEVVCRHEAVMSRHAASGGSAPTTMGKNGKRRRVDADADAKMETAATEAGVGAITG